MSFRFSFFNLLAFQCIRNLTYLRQLACHGTCYLEKTKEAGLDYSFFTAGKNLRKMKTRSP